MSVEFKTGACYHIESIISHLAIGLQYQIMLHQVFALHAKVSYNSSDTEMTLNSTYSFTALYVCQPVDDPATGIIAFEKM